MHLAIRGEVEFRLLKSYAEDPPEDVTAEVDRLTNRVVARWAVAPLSVPPAPVADESAIRRGYELFVGPKVGCLNCHQDFGRKERWLYDEWGTASRVTDLTQGEFRGGSSPEDLFRRVRLGVPAAGMPGTPGLTDAEVWDLVHFVRAAGKAAQLPANVRTKIYSGSK
jgi:mono/diheme cytochrome c family protein